MWAMIPMLRTLLKSEEGMVVPKGPKGRKRPEARNGIPPRALSRYLTWSFSMCLWVGLPREVGEGLVGFGHFDGVFAFGHGVALAAVSGHQLFRQAEPHGTAGFVAGRVNNPANGQALLTGAIDLHRHLVGGPADTLGPDLHCRLDMLHRLSENLDRVGIVQALL